MQRWGEYFFHTPELDLDDDQRDLLRQRYNAQADKGYMFKSDDLTCYYTNPEMLVGIYPDHIVNEIAEKFTGYEFLVNDGEVDVHRDRIRFASLAIPIYNDDELELEFWDEERKGVIERLDYGHKTWIMRTQTPHGVSDKATKPRAFWQASLHGQSFDDIMHQYHEGKLFR
jgi:hypothetical protein